jgi:hypothetical protein
MAVFANLPSTTRRHTVYPPRAMQSALKKIRLSLERNPSGAGIDRAIGALELVRAKAEHIASQYGQHPDWPRLGEIAVKASSRTHTANSEHAEYPAGTSTFLRELLKSASSLLGCPLSPEEKCGLLAENLKCAIAMIDRLAQVAAAQGGAFTAADVDVFADEVPQPTAVDETIALFMESYHPHTKNAAA